MEHSSVPVATLLDERVIAESLIEHCERPKFTDWDRITG